MPRSPRGPAIQSSSSITPLLFAADARPTKRSIVTFATFALGITFALPAVLQRPRLEEAAVALVVRLATDKPFLAPRTVFFVTRSAMFRWISEQFDLFWLRLRDRVVLRALGTIEDYSRPKHDQEGSQGADCNDHGLLLHFVMSDKHVCSFFDLRVFEIRTLHLLYYTSFSIFLQVLEGCFWSCFGTKNLLFSFCSQRWADGYA